MGVLKSLLFVVGTAILAYGVHQVRLSHSWSESMDFWANQGKSSPKPAESPGRLSGEKLSSRRIALRNDLVEVERRRTEVLREQALLDSYAREDAVLRRVVKDPRLLEGTSVPYERLMKIAEDLLAIGTDAAGASKVKISALAPQPVLELEDLRGLSRAEEKNLVSWVRARKDSIEKIILATPDAGLLPDLLGAVDVIEIRSGSAVAGGIARGLRVLLKGQEDLKLIGRSQASETPAPSKTKI